MTRSATAENVLQLADQCVKCGLCLPHCPTYALAQDEAESPRGRIALARAVASERIKVSDSVLTHLDQCLACRACETACPSNVEYERLLIGARALIEPARPRRTLVHWMAAHPRILTELAGLARVTRAGAWAPALARALPVTSSLRRWLMALPRTRTLAIHGPASAAATGEPIALFEGCVASEFDRDTLAATRFLLTRLGHEVVTTKATLCCGALPRHAGHANAAQAIAERTRTSLAALDVNRVVVSASGCYSALADTVGDSGIVVVDAAQCIADHRALGSLRFRPLHQRVVLHLPCSQVNGSHSADATRDLLARIPGLTVVELPDQPRCCGAAGSHFLEHPKIADQLRDQRLDQIDFSTRPPALLLTSNIGCRIHLGNGLHQRGSAVPVLHPLTLLAQQLDIE